MINNRRLPLFVNSFLIAAFLLSPSMVRAELIESFDYPVTPLEEMEVNKAPNAWGVPLESWHSVLRLKPEFVEGDTLPPFIVEGSLEFEDSSGTNYPTAGNRVQNPSGSNYNLTLGHALDLKNSSFVAGALQGDASDQNPERSIEGWGSPDQTLWFSALTRITGYDHGNFSISLLNRAYSTGPNGLSLVYTPKLGSLKIGQIWSSLGAHHGAENSASGEVTVSPGEVIWIVGRIQTGPEWGHSEAYKHFHPSSRDLSIPEPTGNLTIWINPLIGSEPDENMASLQIPLHEFRINNLQLVLEPEAEMDEIRLGFTFEDLTR